MSLAGCLSPELVREYPRVRVALFYSTVDTTASGFSYGHVANTPSGYVTEMEKCAQSSNAMGTKEIKPSPYSTRLRLLTDITEVLKTETGVLLESIEFLGYDSTRGGSAHQSTDNNTAIEDSQSSVLDAYMASHFRGGIIGNHQPNYCRPTVVINDIPVLEMDNSGVSDPVTGARNHLGDLSIGIPLPFSVDYYREFERVTTIEVFGGLAQWIESSDEPASKLVRYPLLCMIRFRLK